MSGFKPDYNIQTYGFGMDSSDILEGILEARKIEDTMHFFNPSLDDLLDSDELPDMQKGIDILCAAIDNDVHVYLSVDSDTDGITSGAIMYRWLRHRGVTQIDYFVSRGKHHGLCQELADDVIAKGADLLIVMDSLDSSADFYQQIRQNGIEILVLDHHDIDAGIPYRDYVTLVSSFETANPFLSGAGVVWKICCETDKVYDDDYCFENLSDLAATGLVADMMDMSQDYMETRFIVSHGLDNQRNTAIKKIIKSYPFTSKSIGYSVAPLVNASCRYFKNELAFKAFISDDEKQIKALIKEMMACREQQNEDVEYFMDLNMDVLSKQNDWPYNFIVIDTEFGICGLIANKIKAMTGKPVFVVVKREGRYEGSGRGVHGNLREITHEITPSAFGKGHPSAFGFGLDIEEYELFHEAICKALEGMEPEPINVDCELTHQEIDYGLVNGAKEIERLAGNGFPYIRFLIRDAGIELEISKNGRHLYFVNPDGFYYIQWNGASQIGKYDDYMGGEICFTGSLDIQYAGGSRKPVLIVEDVWAQEEF